MLFSTGANAGAAKRPAGVEQRGRQRGEPVEQDLRDEQPQQRHAHRRQPVGLAVVHASV